ncbi:hypothetical protein, partial [Methylovulum psychrotolerans]|uniref:hypothetical protein n=1 Tax=Methylovulum psychrotolerans TaxID=1704499 RepID=UPI00147626FD
KKARVREPTPTPSQLKPPKKLYTDGRPDSKTQNRPVTRNLTDDIPAPIALPTDGTAPPPPFKNPAELKKWMAENRIGEETDKNEFTDNWTYEDTHETSRY